MDYRLVQKIVHKPTGQEFDLGYVTEFTFVETMDLSGPKVIMRMRDPLLFHRDNLKLAADDELTITLSDTFAREGMDAEMDFTVLSVPDGSSKLIVNCMASAVLNTKRPVGRSRLFSVGAVANMLGELFPGIKQEIAKCPITEAYHVLAGERPSMALRQMAKEQGGHVFLDRDKIVLKRIDELMARDPDFIYHHNDNREQNQIISYQAKNPKYMIKDKLKRCYSGFDITNGWVKSTKNSDAAPERYSSAAGLVLSGINSVPVPVLDCTVTGNGYIRAGSVMGIEWHTARTDAPLNEALPEKVVVWAVSHYYSDMKYFCRIKGVNSL